MTKQFLFPRRHHERLGFHVEICRRLIREGRLRAIHIGKRLRIPLADIEAYEAAHRIMPAKEVAP